MDFDPMLGIALILLLVAGGEDLLRRRGNRKRRIRQPQAKVISLTPRAQPRRQSHPRGRKGRRARGDWRCVGIRKSPIVFRVASWKKVSQAPAYFSGMSALA